MKYYLKNILPFLYVSVKLVQQLRTQHRYIKQELEPHLLHALQNNDGSLNDTDFKKIRNYYALFVVAIVGENYCRLRGLKMSSRERKILSYQGAMTGLYDDFFDHENRDNTQVKEMMSDPFDFKARNSAEKLFLIFLQEVHRNLEDKATFENIFNEIYTVQLESKKQLNSLLTASQLKQISEKKGGWSHLFYRITLSNSLEKEEQTALFELGSLLQQVNDIFDVWKDLQSGISTFVTQANDIHTLKADFELQMKKVQQLLYNLPYKATHKRDCFFQFMILIGMGIVALNQYLELQKNNNGRFEAANFTRKQLVCDMQKKSNLFKLMKVCLSYNFNH
ncbi:MAG TPA: hypothetical protein PLN13_13460 [Bacteroidia bacterium]|nr:hypothetical protein [Bacteroidia bacterium]HRH09585.1 hypothetical protein [Bacteroidia bacterium]